MSTWAVSMMRDEADIAPWTVRHMLTQVDEVLIADNGSKDGTRELLEEMGVKVLNDGVRAYYQSQKITALAHFAEASGARWIVPFDADEVWYSPHGRIKDVLADIDPEFLVTAAELYDHVVTGADRLEANPLRRIGWRRREPGALPKVACRARPDLLIEQGNHGARYDGGATYTSGHLVVRHFPYRSAEQFRRKARNGAEAYAATDLPEDVGAHWRNYGRILDEHGPEALDAVFYEWFHVEDPAADDTLIYDPAPVR